MPCCAGFIDPALNLVDGEILQASHFSDGGLALGDVHDHGGFALCGPAFDCGFVAYCVLLIAAL